MIRTIPTAPRQGFVLAAATFLMGAAAAFFESWQKTLSVWQSGSPSPSPSNQPPSVKKKPSSPANKEGLLLIIENDQNNLDFLIGSLDRYQLLTASCGQQGLEMIKLFHPDLILCSTDLPETAPGSCPWLMRELRKDTSLQSLPLLFLTTSNHSLCYQFQEEGMQDYLTQPFSAKELQARVGNLINLKKTRDLLKSELRSQQQNIGQLMQEIKLRQHDLENILMDREKAESTIRQQAFYDSLTGLPNRSLLNDRLAVALHRARRNQELLSVLFLDLDHFKGINETLGHPSGDALLRLVAQRLTSCLREEDTISRFEGDSFAIIPTNLTAAEDASRVARKIQRSLQQPFEIGLQEVHITASIGISFYPTDGESGEELFRNAENALHRAKEAGRNTFRIYTQVMHTQASRRLALENELRRALKNQELTLYYQPIAALQRGKIKKAEALLRWNHPKRGLILPGDFLKVAEESGIIIPIDEWVIEQVCQQIQDWKNRGLTPPVVAVNVSGRQFSHPDFLDHIISTLKKYKISPHSIQLEITEQTAIENIRNSATRLKTLKDLGFHLAMDDFGAGHSSLHYLKELPIELLKIDRSFICNCLHDFKDAAITKTIVSLGHTLNLSVCAEGIESEQQLDFLASLGCDTGQGFWISHPLCEAEFANQL